MCRCCCEVGFPWPMMDVEEEIRVLEEYREALTKELEKINKRLEALKRYKTLNSTRRPL